MAQPDNDPHEEWAAEVSALEDEARDERYEQVCTRPALTLEGNIAKLRCLVDNLSEAVREEYAVNVTCLRQVIDSLTDIAASGQVPAPGGSALPPPAGKRRAGAAAERCFVAKHQIRWIDLSALQRRLS